jgi:hypothetical protein
MTRGTLIRTAKRALIATFALGLVFTALVGFAHTRPGRPLLAVIGPVLGMHGGGKCPLGYDTAATPAAREMARRRFAATHAGSAVAHERPALGFALDETTRGDVLAWASEHHVKCVARKSGPDLDCADVPAAALPDHEDGVPLHSLWLTFGVGDRLIAAVGIRRDPSDSAIGDAFAKVTRDVALLAGPATTTSGDPTSLAAGQLYQAMAEYRFQNYFAVARATNMGDKDGYVLTEEYRSL